MGTTAHRVGRPRTSPRPAVPSRPRNLRYPAPSPQRLRLHRQGKGGIPLVVRVFLGLALLALAGGTVLTATGLGGAALRGLGATVLGALSAPLNGPTPTPPLAVAPGAPRLVLTGSGWTNVKQWTVRGFVPLGLGDQEGYSVRVYVNGDLAAEEALLGTQDFSVAVPIPDGPSLITATIMGPAGEGAESAPIQVVVDHKMPPIKIKAPADGASVDGETVKVRGTTQPDSTVTIRNETNGGRASDVATDGNFSIEISIVNGPNDLEISAIDPAGNARTVTLKVVGSGGAASASLSLTKTSFKLSSLPSAIGASVRVLRPDGQPLNGARVVFTIQVPGIAPIQSGEIVPSDGTASFNTQIPHGATAGLGLVTVLVTTDRYGTLGDSVAFRIS